MSTSLVDGKRLGWVAEFCPICRDICLTALSKAIFTQGKLATITHSLRCSSCGFLRLGDNRNYSSALPSPASTLDELVARTNPQIRQKHSERLEMEELIKDGRLNPGMREDILREPFILLGPEIENPPGGGRIMMVSGFGCAAFILLIVAGALLEGTAAYYANLISLVALLVCLVPIALTMILSSLLTKFWRRRHLRKVVYPMIARAIRPLNLSVEELNRAIEGMNALGITGTRYIDSAELQHTLAQGHSKVELPGPQ